MAPPMTPTKPGQVEDQEAQAVTFSYNPSMTAEQNDRYHPSRPVPPPARLELPLAGGGHTSLFVHSPAPGTPSRLPVLYVHGIQSHPGWFAGSAAFLAAAGHTVFQLTRRGSGDSQCRAGHAQSPWQLMEDLAAAGELIAHRTGSKKLHLLGVSWGGKLLAAWVGTGGLFPAGLEGASLTLVAPGLTPRVDAPVLTKLAVGLSLFCCPRCRYTIPLSEPHLFTDNPHFQQYLRDDPLRLHKATARFLYISRQLDRIVRGLTDNCLDLAVRMVLAERDRIIDNVAAATLVTRLSFREPSIVTLPGAHTLEFEDDPARLYKTILDGLVEP